MKKKGSYRGNAMDRLVRIAEEGGAAEVKVINAKDIVVDKRVRMKCAIPPCNQYGKNLMCPPYVMSVEEFTQILGKYRKALLVQLETNTDSSDKADAPLTGELIETLEEKTGLAEWSLKLHRLINLLETEAFKLGFPFATGFTCGHCRLCEECVPPGNPCRKPFEARPSMEAMGIDVSKTCEKAGIPVSFSSNRAIKLTGLVLLY
ncbi:DUF2284 domain-containing protein [Candidatus Hecatella orcuttiae]|jgi:predicted metal-binding protein|uniref:DUF2284 domain-containing protein n=1 Tax=Candidatus Hecatella orcuttiae TaxID=1935119 RepID=UPI002867DB84|nr:DUF2284 domain-containing protein [Candidatus Hecatella orcuttiae]